MTNYFEMVINQNLTTTNEKVRSERTWKITNQINHYNQERSLVKISMFFCLEFHVLYIFFFLFVRNKNNERMYFVRIFFALLDMQRLSCFLEQDNKHTVKIGPSRIKSKLLSISYL